VIGLPRRQSPRLQGVWRVRSKPWRLAKAWADWSPVAKAAFSEQQPLLRFLLACAVETALNLV
jgi:hypothetical protein